MSQSLSKRFNGNAKEVIEYTRTFGWMKAMEKYDVHCTIAWEKFLEKQTGNKNFGLYPLVNSQVSCLTAETLVDAMVNKVRQMETQEIQLRNELAQCKRELEYFKVQKALELEPKVQTLMGLCQRS